jgi:hypothetical protein
MASSRYILHGVVKLCYNARICWLRAGGDDRSDDGGAGFEGVNTGG